MTDQEKVELLATKVMRWKIVQRPVRVFDPMYPGREIDAPHYEDEDNGTCILVGEWNPLKRIDHAWEVVEKLKGNFDSFCLGHTPDGWFCQFQNILPPELEDDLIRTEEFDGEGKTAQEAICSAAIKLLEVKCE